MTPPAPRIIGIAGGTGSGKSWLAHSLQRALEESVGAPGAPGAPGD